MFLVELQMEGNSFLATPRQRLSFSATRTEKNWSPFIWNGEVCFIYSIFPFRPVQLVGNGFCYLIPSRAPPVRWRWGELRGGTQAIQISDQEYITFFHSSRSDYGSVRYFMGALTFLSGSSFSITGISKEPIVGRGFYSTEERPREIIYPGGVVADGEFFYVSYGKDDHEVWIAKLDRQKLLDQLK